MKKLDLVILIAVFSLLTCGLLGIFGLAGLHISPLLGFIVAAFTSGLIVIFSKDIILRRWKEFLIASTLLASSILIPTAGTLDSQGPNSPNKAINNNEVGTIDWRDPDCACDSDNKYAYAEYKGIFRTHYLWTQQYGFNIPSGATINGIKVEVEKKADLKNGYIVDYSIRLIKYDEVVGDDKADTNTHWPDSDAYASYGGDNDLWGASWTPDDINDDKFGVAISAKVDAPDGGSALIDHVRITVYYTTGGNTAPELSNENPSNGSTNVAVSDAGVTCSVYVSDQDGDTLTVTWATNASTGEWHNVATETVSANTTVSHTYEEFYQYDQTYWWRVYVDDGTENVSETYHFHTEGETHTTDWFDPENYGSIKNEWTNPQNALEDDANYAIVYCSSDKDEEDYYTFDVDIPSYATIKGIEVVFEGNILLVIPQPDDSRISVKLSWNGGSSWSESKIIQFESTSEEAVSVGGSNDLWGTHKWVPNDFSNSNFKLFAQGVVNSSGQSAASQVDYIKMRITYSVTSNQAPTISNPNPANGSVDIPVSPSGITCSAYFADEDGDTLNISWYYSYDGSTWYYDGTDTNKEPNATYSHTYSEFTEEGTTYYWRVYADDSIHNTSSDIWHFKTTSPHIYVICDASDYDLATEYKEWKEANTEYVVYIKTIDSIINDEDYWADGTWGDKNPSNPWYVSQSSWNAASGYNDTACKVRNFIRDKVYNDNAIKAVLIFGKTAYRLTYESEPMWDDVATVDMWYFGALNGTQNKDDDDYFCEGGSDLSDGKIDIPVGRVPFETDSQFYAWFNKTKAYEARAYDAEINKNVIMYSMNISTYEVNDEIWTDYLNYTYLNILDNVGYLDSPESPGFDHCVNESVHNSSEMTEYLNGTHEGYTEGFYMYLVRAHGGYWWEDPDHSPDDGCFNYTGAEEKAFIVISCGCGDNAWLDDVPNQDTLPVLLWQVGGAVMTIGSTKTISGPVVYQCIQYIYADNYTFGDAIMNLLNEKGFTTSFSGLSVLGDPTLRPKYPEYTNIEVYGPTMKNNTFSIPGHPYAKFKFINFNNKDIDSADVYFKDGNWQLAKSFSDGDVENYGIYSTLYSGCSSTDTTYLINVTCTADSVTSKAVMKFKTHPYDNSWSVFYIEKNDTDQLQPQIHGRLDGLSYAYYYKYEGLIDGEYQTLEEGVGSTEQNQITISNTTFMSDYGNYTLRYTISSTGVTRTKTFVKTIRTNYPTPDLTLLPNDNGTVNDDDITAHGATYKWQCIDDGSSHDSDTTYIEGGIGEETFNFEDTTSKLKYLKIVIVSRATGGTYNHLYVTLKSGFQLTRIAKIRVDNTNYQTFIVYISKNPFTNENWTANDLTNLEVGFYFDPAMAIPSPKIRCTSLYIEGTIENTPPTLSNPSATPSVGEASSTVFYFNITYSDPDNDSPSEIKVNITKPGWYLNASMTYVSGDNLTGALYSYSTTLKAGVYDILFYAFDGEDGTVNDPDIQVKSTFRMVVRADGEDYFIWVGKNCTASEAVEDIPGFDEASEYIAIWNGTTWDSENGLWIFYYGDGTGEDFYIHTYDVIRIYLTDTGTVEIYATPNNYINYSATRTVLLINSTNKGANYTGYTGSTTTLSDIVDDAGLEDGEVIGYWDNSTYEWEIYVVGFSNLNVEIDKFTVVYTKVGDTRTWNIPGPEA